MTNDKNTLRDCIQISLAGALGVTVGIMLAVSYSYVWYLGALAGGLIAGFACGPREVIKTAKEVFDALHTTEIGWDDVKEIGILASIFIGVIIAIVIVVGTWIFASYMWLLHLANIIASPSTPDFTKAQNQVAIGTVAFMSFVFLCLSLAFLEDIKRLAQKKYRRYRSTIDRHCIICTYLGAVLCRFSLSNKSLCWIFLVTLPLLPAIGVIGFACIISLVICDYALALCMLLAQTNQIACTLNGFIGTIAGYWYWKLGYSSSLPPCILVGIGVGWFVGHLAYFGHRFCEERMDDILFRLVDKDKPLPAPVS